MKTSLPYLIGALGGGALLLIATPLPTHGDPASDLIATGTLVDDVSVQQTKLIENQTKIDEKIAFIAEEVRQARLFVARGGGKK